MRSWLCLTYNFTNQHGYFNDSKVDISRKWYAKLSNDYSTHWLCYIFVIWALVMRCVRAHVVDFSGNVSGFNKSIIDIWIQKCLIHSPLHRFKPTVFVYTVIDIYLKLCPLRTLTLLFNHVSFLFFIYIHVAVSHNT